jgi:hypothetical protein
MVGTIAPVVRGTLTRGGSWYTGGVTPLIPNLGTALLASNPCITPRPAIRRDTG